ncbi:MAG: glycosyltransferase family 39 protein, partial [Armatimonadetes bacterium]|nr:glycosyltransferase family 39 protein [Armatimonadota bacterium]
QRVPGPARPRPRDLTERLNVFARAAALAVLIALLGIGTFGRFYTARFNGLVSTTAMEIGDIAQQLRAGHGMSTKVIRPLALAYGQPNEEGVMPETLHAPLYPLLLSWLFKVRGGGDATIAMFNGLMFLLTGWVIFAIARLLWDKVVGLLAVALYFVSVEAIGQALTASGATLAGLLITIAIWAALRNRQSTETSQQPNRSATRRGFAVWPAIIGAMFGLIYLAGLTSLLLVIPLAVLATTKSPMRWRQVAIMAIAALVVTLPWAARNLLVTGSLSPPLAKYGLLTHTQTYPGESVFQQMPGQVPQPIFFVLSHPGEMLTKVVNGLTVVYRGGPSILNLYLFAFFIFGAFLFGASSLKRCVWRVAVAMLALQALSICLYTLEAHGMGVLLPILLCLAVGSLIEALRQTEASRSVQVLVAVVVFGLVLFPTASSAVLGGKTPGSRSLGSLSVMRDRLGEDAVIATDSPAGVAWYAHKQAVLLPATPSELGSLEQRGIKADYVYFSHAISGPVFPKGLEPWHELLRSEEGRKSLGRFQPLPYGEMIFERASKPIGSEVGE